MSYADQDHVAGSYEAAATRYSDAWQSDSMPHATQENELVRRLLGDCAGYRILDIAGGSGNHARQAVELGASHVDVVDISAGFMDVGKAIEAKLGRKAIIDWHLADAYKPIAEQVPSLPLAGYDLVMAIWAFDHVADLGELRGLWANIAAYLKPGGRLVAVRVANAKAESAREPKYGIKFHSHEDIKDGLSYAYTMSTEPPFTVEASSMHASMLGSTELPEKAGIVDMAVFDHADTDTVKANPDYWELLLKDPYWVGFTAVKK